METRRDILIKQLKDFILTAMVVLAVTATIIIVINQIYDAGYREGLKTLISICNSEKEGEER